MEKIGLTLNTSERLSSSQRSAPDALTAALQAREAAHGAALPFHPVFPVESVAVGAFYLDEITTNYVRIYKRREL